MFIIYWFIIQMLGLFHLFLTDPIQPSKDATDASYHKNMDYLLSNDAFVVLASHNNDTVQLAKKQ